MNILLVEGNPRRLIEQGYPDYAQYFVDCLITLDPSLSFQFAAPFEAPLLDACLESINGAVFTGSSTASATDAAEYKPQMLAMERVFERGIPCWGSCAGLQLAAVVLGGRVGASPNGVEVGLARDLVLTTAGQQHAMMRARQGRKFAVPCIHRDEVRSYWQQMLIHVCRHLPTMATVWIFGARSITPNYRPVPLQGKPSA